jgi:hypothetical protein
MPRNSRFREKVECGNEATSHLRSQRIACVFRMLHGVSHAFEQVGPNEDIELYRDIRVRRFTATRRRHAERWHHATSLVNIATRRAEALPSATVRIVDRCQNPAQHAPTLSPPTAPAAPAPVRRSLDYEFNSRFREAPRCLERQPRVAIPAAYADPPSRDCAHIPSKPSMKMVSS